MQSAGFLQLWAWYEKNKKQVIYGATGVVALALIVWFILWQKDEKEREAGRALSSLSIPQMMDRQSKPHTAEDFLALSAKYPNTSAGAQALLRGAGLLFADGKYAEAYTQFQKFAGQYRENPFVGQAMLGLAASLEGQGKPVEATEAYRTLVERHPNESVTPQAKFALARLYQSQGKPELAKPLYEDLATKDPYGSIGSEAGMNLEEMKQSHPALFQPKAAAAPVAAGTNAPKPAATTNAPAAK
jgi:TolA-binding protein